MVTKTSGVKNNTANVRVIKCCKSSYYTVVKDFLVVLRQLPCEGQILPSNMHARLPLITCTRSQLNEHWFGNQNRPNSNPGSVAD